MESNSTSNSIQSAMADLLDRCSSPPPLPIDSVVNDVRSCLTDLCQRVSSIADEPAVAVYNPIPSPVFKRKSEDQSRRAPHLDDASTKKKRNRSATKKNDALLVASTGRKDEPVEQETVDVKPIVPASTDYVCEWDNCRK